MSPRRLVRTSTVRAGSLGTLAVSGLLLSTLAPPVAQAAPAPTAYDVRQLTSRTGQPFTVSGRGNPVNDRGLVAGSTTVDGRSRAAVFNLATRTIRVLTAFRGRDTAAADVNRSGEVTGEVRYPGQTTKALYWSTRTGQAWTLSGPGGTQSQGVAINDRGVVAGTVGDPVSSRGALWHTRTGRRVLLPLDRVAGINRAGAVVGYRVEEIGEITHVRPVVWRPGGAKETTLQALPGDDSAMPSDISDTGIVVGESHSLVRDDNVTRPVMWRARRVAPCRLPSAAGSGSANAVNDGGLVVGVKVLSPTEESPVVWNGCADPGVLLSSDRRSFTVATGINDRGQVVGRSPFTGSVVWTP